MICEYRKGEAGLGYSTNSVDISWNTSMIWRTWAMSFSGLDDSPGMLRLLVQMCLWLSFGTVQTTPGKFIKFTTALFLREYTHCTSWLGVEV
jgi:hypothetical protein